MCILFYSFIHIKDRRKEDCRQMKRLMMVSLSIILFLLLSACGGEDTGKQAEYDTTKKMVIDILQTDDGKKALAEILADEKMKKDLVMDSDIVKEAVNDVVASDKGKEMWKKLFEDPKFAEKFAKSLEAEQEKLMKSLLGDPEYQEKMIDLFKDPEVTKHTLQLLKSQEFNKHLQTNIQETLENPIFQAKIQEVLLKAAEKQGQDKGQQEEGNKEQQQQQSGGTDDTDESEGPDG